MPVRLDHTIVRSQHKQESAEFLAKVLDLAPPIALGPFFRIELADGVCLDYHDSEDLSYQHYALLVDDGEFDAMLKRMDDLGYEYYAQGRHRGPHEITQRSGGARAVYFTDPDNVSIEIITRHFVPEESQS